AGCGAARHASWSGHSACSGGERIRRGSIASCVPFHEPASHSREGVRARWLWSVAVRTPSAAGALYPTKHTSWCTHLGARIELSTNQLQALVVGLPWERLNEHAKVSVL